MKKNNLNIILFIIIGFLLFYIVYDKVIRNDILKNDGITVKDSETEIIKEIDFDYVSICLTEDGTSYIKPLNKNEIENLDVNKNLKDRLTTLYEKAIYYDIHVGNNKLKGYKLLINDKVKELKRVETEDGLFVILLKEDNTMALFNYSDYYNLMYVDPIDNYKDYKDIKMISDNKIIYLDGSSEEFK